MKKKIDRPNTAVIYVRVSSKEQVDGYSLANQENECRKYAERHGFTILSTFREEGESAKFADRTQLQAMLKYCTKNMNKVGHVLVWKVDRFARNLEDHIQLRHHFRQVGTELVSVTEHLEDTPQGKLFERMLANFAEFDNDVRTERTVNGMKSRLEDGYWAGKAPWGYVNTKSRLGEKIIEPDPKKVPIVQYLFKEYAKGCINFRQLAKKANAKFEVSSFHKNGLSKQLVYKILKNPIHCGIIYSPSYEVRTKGRHTPIISENLYEKVQAIIGGSRKKYKRSRHTDSNEFPLRGVKCGGCGGSITGGRTRGRGGIYKYYSCYNKQCSKRKHIQKIDFESSFTEFLQSITPNDELLDALALTIKLMHQSVGKEKVTALRKVNGQIAKLDEEINKLLQLQLDGVIDSNEYATQVEKRKSKKRDLEDERKNLSSPMQSSSSAVEFGIRFIRELPTCWPMLKARELRTLRELLFPQNLCYSYPVFQTPEIAPIYTLKSLKSDEVNLYVTPRGIEPRFSP